jgi:hypothetical protein
MHPRHSEVLSFGVPLSSLIWPLGLLIPALYFLLLSMYGLQARTARYWPTMSETAIEPNSAWGCFVLTQVGFVTFTMGMLLLWWICSFCQSSFAFKLFCVSLGVVGLVAQVGLADAPLHTAPIAHACCAVGAFGAGSVFKVLMSVAAFKKAEWRKCVGRLAIVACEVLSVLICATCDRFVDKRIEDTIGAIGEWAFLMIGLSFFITLQDELSSSTIAAIVEV